MSIINKFGKIFIISCLFLFSILPITAHAEPEQYLVTLLIIPEESISYTDYDSAYLVVINQDTEESFKFTLYPYNHFSNKIWLDAGTYSVLEAGINGRSDVIFITEAEDVVVDCNTAIIANLKDSKIIQTTTITTTTTTTQSDTNVTNEQGLTVTQKREITTLFSTPVSENPSATDPESILTTNSQINPSSVTPPYNISTNITETTTGKDSEITGSGDTLVIPATIIIGIISIICIVFFIVLHKKNKAEE